MASSISDNQLAKIIVSGLVICVCALLFSITSCSIKELPYKENDAQRQHERIMAEREREAAEQEAIKVLISDFKIDPINARCTVKGWKNDDRETELCKRFTPGADKDLADRMNELTNRLIELSKSNKELASQINAANDRNAETAR